MPDKVFRMLFHIMLLLYKLSCTVYGEGTHSTDTRHILEIPESGEYEDDNKPSKIFFFLNEISNVSVSVCLFPNSSKLA